MPFEFWLLLNDDDEGSALGDEESEAGVFEGLVGAGLDWLKRSLKVKCFLCLDLLSLAKPLMYWVEMGMGVDRNAVVRNGRKTALDNMMD